MSVFVSTQPAQYEQMLLDLVRALPSNRVTQLIDFARFLAAQSLEEELTWQEEPVVMEADNAQWDRLLATEEAQMLLNQLADEALAEHLAGRTKPMAFTTQGRIIPG